MVLRKCRTYIIMTYRIVNNCDAYIRHPGQDTRLFSVSNSNRIMYLILCRHMCASIYVAVCACAVYVKVRSHQDRAEIAFWSAARWYKCLFYLYSMSAFVVQSTLGHPRNCIAKACGNVLCSDLKRCRTLQTYTHSCTHTHTHHTEWTYSGGCALHVNRA